MRLHATYILIWFTTWTTINIALSFQVLNQLWHETSQNEAEALGRFKDECVEINLAHHGHDIIVEFHSLWANTIDATKTSNKGPPMVFSFYDACNMECRPKWFFFWKGLNCPPPPPTSFLSTFLQYHQVIVCLKLTCHLTRSCTVLENTTIGLQYYNYHILLTRAPLQ